jgi:dicarboxylate transporter 10
MEDRTAESTEDSSVGQCILHYPFWLGGSASCFAAGVTHPLDLGEIYPFLLDTSKYEASTYCNIQTLVKVRLQTRSANAPNTMMGTFVHVVKHNGLKGLYNGVCIYTSLRTYIVKTKQYVF